jgi:Fic family protein
VRLEDAHVVLARLDGAAELIQSLEWFLHAFIRKEAVLSSQIEGTQATLVDLFSFEARPETFNQAHDVHEVSNYVAALAWARKELSRKRGLPISMRLLNRVHRRLMRSARGGSRAPGELRKSRNWVGGTRPGNAVFVPPPPHRLPELIAGLERYVYSNDSLPVLIRAGLVHVQFETIHPYLDGNGRVGRLLISLLLEHWGFLRLPVLYLSLHFKRNRDEYYRRLNTVRIEGDWEGWTSFVLEGVSAVASEATAAARDIFALVNTDRVGALSAPTGSAMAARLFERVPENPILTIARVAKLLDTSKPTAIKAVDALVEAGILSETTGRRRDRTFAYTDYLEMLRTGTELES